MNNDLEEKNHNAGQYKGEYKNGQRHGYGILCWSDGTYYEGQFVNGLRHGNGKMIIPSKNSTIIYDGNFRQGKRHGYGKQQQQMKKSTTSNNNKSSVVINTYMGQWKDDQINGKGYMKMKDGKEYAGEFQNGIRQGYGFLMYTNGKDIYIYIYIYKLQYYSYWIQTLLFFYSFIHYDFVCFIKVLIMKDSFLRTYSTVMVYIIPMTMYIKVGGIMDLGMEKVN